MMLNNKRGLSAIVTTLIIILLTIVSIGIVWVVVRNVLSGGTESVDWNAKCIAVSIAPIRLVCSGTPNNDCNVWFKRQGAGTDAISGVKLVFKNDTAQQTSAVFDFQGNVPALLEQKTPTTGTYDASTVTNGVNKVEATPYFKDAGGVEKYCTTASYP